jgi:hypothetical protein
VIEAECTDPDCELHNIWVAIEEEVCNLTDVAFFMAGAQVAMAIGYDRLAKRVANALTKGCDGL